MTLPADDFDLWAVRAVRICAWNAKTIDQTIQQKHSKKKWMTFQDPILGRWVPTKSMIRPQPLEVPERVHTTILYYKVKVESTTVTATRIKNLPSLEGRPRAEGHEVRAGQARLPASRRE